MWLTVPRLCRRLERRGASCAGRKSTAQTGAQALRPARWAPVRGRPALAPPSEALEISCSLGNRDVHVPHMLARKWDAFVGGRKLRKLPVRDVALFYLAVGETGREAS